MRTGSFTAAAAELGLAQQSVSEQVRLLERACGVALFIRVGRGLRPTEAAGALAPHAERALAASEQAVAAARAVRDIVAGTVRLGVFGTMRYYVGADLVASILKRYPDLRASEQYRRLQAQLAEVEGEIQYARRIDNANVQRYNSRLRGFPGSLVRRLGGYRPTGYFELSPVRLDDAAEPRPPAAGRTAAVA